MIKIDEVNLLNTKKNEVKNSLEEFYNSKEFRTFVIQGQEIVNTSAFRGLISDQIEPLKDLVSKGVHTEETAIFNYVASDGTAIPLKLSELIDIRIKMVINDMNPLFVKKEELLKQVDTLTTIEDINNWLINSKTILQDLKDSL